MSRVLVDDLLLAAWWCDGSVAAGSFKGAEAEALLRVARWLEAEAAKRQEEAVVREVVQQLGVTPPRLAPPYAAFKGSSRSRR
jgi:hypothetical protein